MKLLVLGSTGPTGMHVLSHALNHGDDVSVLVRSPEKLGEQSGRIAVTVGDARKADDLSHSMVGCDAVVSALGRGTSPRNGGLFTDAAEAVIEAAHTTGVKRLVWLSSFGVGDTIRTATPPQRFLYRSFLRGIYANKAAAEELLRDSDLDWTLVYPTTLTNGPSQGRYRIGESLVMRGRERIARADVGAFMHEEAHAGRWVRRGVVISG
ncbi:MAG: NAD-dependent epimerase/dehydratase family protein [Actinomyces succiniciruminis]|nr:NAD-dependent epimerase/dehydratase family protein [Actinomyces succiniciruminis]